MDCSSVRVAERMVHAPILMFSIPIAFDDKNQNIGES